VDSWCSEDVCREPGAALLAVSYVVGVAKSPVLSVGMKDALVPLAIGTSSPESQQRLPRPFERAAVAAAFNPIFPRVCSTVLIRQLLKRSPFVVLFLPTNSVCSLDTIH